MPDFVETARLTCPHCQAISVHRMPTDACLFFHVCADCGEHLRPQAGDCCVFCSYADVKCPPIQTGGCCGTSDS